MLCDKPTRLLCRPQLQILLRLCTKLLTLGLWFRSRCLGLETVSRRRTNVSSRSLLEKNCHVSVSSRSRLGLGRLTSRSRPGLGHLSFLPKTNFRPKRAGHINTKNSSGDEITNVNFLQQHRTRTTAHNKVHL